MAELMDVADAFSIPLKVAWVVWIAWGVGQWFWYRQESRPQSASTPAPTPVRKVTPPRRAVAAQPVVRNLVTPEPVVENSGSMNDLPAFDPSAAVVETFSSVGQELDSFVTDFESNHGPRRRRSRSADSNGGAGMGVGATQSM